ncbi:hypothetical protein [Saccharomonospora glauca]|uniref:Secreted protein n=1 Tax=Saccharomonospora glauca K62 TaxID=928724 RepID=I1D0G5_9PSEU|nr:hypothetical protein [Saccharomonospora glauca]EIE98439.1 hypothetical protein SacglDRAFT_01518 [Saccharomonospora glauca K62]
MRKLVTGVLVGLGLLASAAPAVATVEEWYYTGYWYPTEAACEQAYLELVGSDPRGGGLPHECRYNAGADVYELWQVRP